MNWGRSLFITMTIFILFVVGLGIYMAINADSLVETDYYEKGENHTALMMAEEIGADVTMDYVNGNLSIQLPKLGRVNSVSFKNMGNSSLDKNIKLTHDSEPLQQDFVVDIPLPSGQWFVTVYGSLENMPFIKKAKWMVD